MSLLTISELESVYDLYRNEIKAFLHSVNGDPEECEDLLHAVFERLIQLTAEGRVRRDSVRPFLYRLARNIQIDAHRRGSAEDRRLRMTAPDEAVHPGVDESARILAVVKGACRDHRLTERQRTVLHLRFLRRMGISEIESTLRISHNALYRDLKGIREFLRRAFEEAGLTPEDLEDSR